LIGIDTNVLVRYLAQDDAAQSARATRLIEKDCSAEAPGFVPIVVLVEIVWVSESAYRATRAEVAEIVRRLLSIRQLVVENAETAWKALRAFEGSRSDFADCVIHHTAVVAGCDRVVTFDKQAARGGMSLLR
jgi:predicted nucleic-acid-binding protein